MAATSPLQSTPRGPRPVPELRGDPVVGHLRRIGRDRAGLFLDVAHRGPAVALRVGLRKIVVLSSPSLANEALTQKERSFVKGPGLTIFLKPVLGSGLLTSEGELHERQRKLLAPAFTHKRIAAYADTMRERAERFAADLRDGDALDVADAMMRLTLEIVGKTLFDAEVGSDADRIGEGLTVAMKTVLGQMDSLLPMPPQVPTLRNRRYHRAVQDMDAVLFRIIEERRRQSEDRGDVLSVLLRAQDDGGRAMSAQQVRDEAMTLFVAGHETTANALAWTFYLLARNPDVRARMEEELDALGRSPRHEDLESLPFTLAVLKESMRLYPPAYVVARRAIEDVVVGDYLVPKNTILVVNILGIHRRPDLYPDPDRFDPTRFLGDAERALPRCGYMPFGAGRRVCIGNHFATMEGHILLATIARQVRFASWGNQAAAFEPLVTLRPKGGLPVVVRRRA